MASHVRARNLSRARGAYAVLLSALLPVALSAQGTPQSAATSTPVQDNVREEVTVRGVAEDGVATARTAGPLRDAPLTVETLSSQLIAAQAVNDLVSLLRNAPGVFAFTTYGVYEYYSFRGFQDSVQLVDGIRNEGNRINTQLANVERVEILKGPASALYGGGALGGTVNIIRKQPSATPSLDASASAGSFGTWRSALGLGGRLAGGPALYRLDVGAERSDGYRHNRATRFTFSPTITWRAAGATSVDVSYTASRDRFAGDAGLPLTGLGPAASIVENLPAVPLDRNYRTPYDDATSVDHNLQASFTHQITQAITFRNTTSYRHFNDEYFLSEAVTFEAPSTVLRDYLYFHHHRRPLSNRSEISARIGGRIEHNVLAGWEGLRYRSTTTLPEEDFFSAAPIDAFDPVETQGPSDLTPVRANVFTNVTNAFYLQDHFALARNIKVLVGGRYDIYRRTSHSDVIADGVQIAGPESQREANAFTSRVGAVYQPAASVDLYGSFSTAFKPLTQAQPDGSSLDPERGTQWEVGQRLRLLRDRVQLDTSVYRINRRNVAFQRPGNVYVQAGEVESRGLDADLRLRGAQWQAQAGYGFTNASFLDYQESATSNLRGNTPTFAPRHTFTAWTGYQWANGFGAHVGGRYSSETFADNANDFRIPGYGVVNAAIRYARGPLEYAVNINNLTDTTYFVAHQDYLQVYPGEAVNVMATVRVRFR